MQASPSTVIGRTGAVAALAAQGFQLPSATLHEGRPAMSMHSETTSPR